MDKSLDALCSALKKVFVQLKPQHHAISFVLIIGKQLQGKSTILRQSRMEHLTTSAEGAHLYFNQQGIVLELGESWLNQSEHLLSYTLKRINRAHRTIKISGLILCIDVNELLLASASEIKSLCGSHHALLKRFGVGLGYIVDMAFLFTKLDVLAGFCDFFQNEHEQDLQKPLGFSLHQVLRPSQLQEIFKTQFDQLIESLGQQVIPKIHPVRSSVKRTLIREFPLQLATLRATILLLVSHVSPKLFRLQSLYFTSGEQGGIGVDRLNKKIQHEYALTIKDEFFQSVNHRAYFIEGALLTFQTQTLCQPPTIKDTHQWITAVMAGSMILSLIWIGHQYLTKSELLDKVSKELIAYDSLAKGQQESLATYHLSKATNTLEKISSNNLTLPTIHTLKKELINDTNHYVSDRFLPTLLHEIEQTITDGRQSQIARFEALKIYLMLADGEHFSKQSILNWFQAHNKQDSDSKLVQQKLSLLQSIFHSFKPIAINQQIVMDARNYLNALPASYLYYSLAKAYFPNDTKPIPLKGFSSTQTTVPIYLTKSGFHNIIEQLPKIIEQLKKDNWVLKRQDLSELPILLQQAYCYEYVIWWQHFMQKTNPVHIQDYDSAHQLMQTLRQSNTINQLIAFIQQETSPETGDNASLFNNEIANKFTELSLLSHSAAHHLTLTINELEKFLATLSVVHDQGKTAFNLTKSRFQGDILTNPLSSLYNHAKQLPLPIATWAQQIADDTWFTLINDSRNYINQQWQTLVYHEYAATIANRYPFDQNQSDEISMVDFNRFFATNGTLNHFINDYLKPFLDTSNPQWQLKETDHYVLPISSDMINELIRANVISNMFFPNNKDTCQIDFSLQKISLDPIVSSLGLSIGSIKMTDTQTSDSYTDFHWPASNARLVLNSIEGKHYELEELGTWAFFKILQKVNVLVDEQDSANLQILFEINGNSGRYLLKTENQVNPFIPGILNEFSLPESIV